MPILLFIDSVYPQHQKITIKVFKCIYDKPRVVFPLVDNQEENIFLDSDRKPQNIYIYTQTGQ